MCIRRFAPVAHKLCRLSAVQNRSQIWVVAYRSGASHLMKTVDMSSSPGLVGEEPEFAQSTRGRSLSDKPRLAKGSVGASEASAEFMGSSTRNIHEQGGEKSADGTEFNLPTRHQPWFRAQPSRLRFGGIDLPPEGRTQSHLICVLYDEQ